MSYHITTQLLRERGGKMGIYYGLMEEIQKLATWLDDVGELDRMV